ncbi:hypothetical protein ATCC90586_009998 [Pythium insidiosum]|nr:hypothetical protein ATCC90586_009998 [Pythium insidiosum]
MVMTPVSGRRTPLLIAAAVACMLATTPVALAQTESTGSGASGESAGLPSPPPVATRPSRWTPTVTEAAPTPSPVVTEAPATLAPVKTKTPKPTEAAETPAPAVTTVAEDTPSPAPSTAAPVVTEPAASTPAVTSAKPTKTKKATSDDNSDRVESAAPTPTPAPEPKEESGLAGVSAPSGASYGKKTSSEDDKSSGSSNDAKTSQASGSSSSAMNIAVVVAGFMGVVLVAAVSVYMYQRREAEDALEEEKASPLPPFRPAPPPTAMMASVQTQKAAMPIYDPLTSPERPNAMQQSRVVSSIPASVPAVASPVPSLQMSEVSCFEDVVRESEMTPQSERQTHFQNKLTVPSTSNVVESLISHSVGENDVEGDDEDEETPFGESLEITENFVAPAQDELPNITPFTGKSECSSISDYDLSLLDSNGTSFELNIDLDLDIDDPRASTASGLSEVSAKEEFAQFHGSSRGTATFITNNLEFEFDGSIDHDAQSDRVSDFTVDEHGAGYSLSVSSSIADLHDAGRMTDADEEFEV